METRKTEEQMESSESGNLIAASKVEGTPVMNTAGEKLGSIENVMIDELTGKVAYAVMSFGGFLGIGDRHYPLPWNVLKYDTNLDGYVVNLDKQMIEGAPTYGTDEEVDWADREWARRVHDYSQGAALLELNITENASRTAGQVT
jgi:sporulation protein YlmC with PRC-barrel domain